MSDLNAIQSVCDYTEKVKVKEEKKIYDVIFSAFLAGVFISIGAFVSVNVGIDLPLGLSKFIGGIAFSSALIMIVLLGQELFTGNVLTTFSFIVNKFNFHTFIKLWVVVYFGNLAGCFSSAYLLMHSGLYPALQNKFVQIATMKASLPFEEAFIRGIFCNLLVYIAVLIANQAKSVQGKILGILVPITVFIASGYEHSVANMFFLPMGQVNMAQFLHNIVPVTLGNIVGALFLVFVLYIGCRKSLIK